MEQYTKPEKQFNIRQNPIQQSKTHQWRTTDHIIKQNSAGHRSKSVFKEKMNRISRQSPWKPVQINPKTLNEPKSMPRNRGCAAVSNRANLFHVDSPGNGRRREKRLWMFWIRFNGSDYRSDCNRGSAAEMSRRLSGRGIGEGREEVSGDGEGGEREREGY